MTTAEHLDQLGVKRLPPRTCPLDPGYDPDSVVSHLSQSGHLMTSLKISTAAWLVADEASTRRKFEAARSQGVATVTGGTPFEVAVHQNLLPEYLEVCAELGAARVECARGFTEPDLSPEEVVGMAAERPSRPEQAIDVPAEILRIEQARKQGLPGVGHPDTVERGARHCTLSVPSIPACRC